MNKRGIGIGLEYIIIAAIAVLVLVIAISFVIGGSGSFLSQIISSGPDPVQSSKTICETACTGSQEVISEEDWETSAYCTKTFTIDLNKNDRFEENEIGIKCYSEILNVACTSGGMIDNKQKIICNQDDCSVRERCSVSLV